MKKSFSAILKTLGVLLLTMAALFGWVAINSLIERIGHGTGLMFADVEIYTMLFLVFLILGILCFWFEKKIIRTKE